MKSVLRLCAVLGLAFALAGCAAPTRDGSRNVPQAPAAPPAAVAGTDSATPTPTSSLASQTPPARADIEATARRLASGTGTTVEIAAIRDIRTAQDASGRWWVAARVVPSAAPRVEVADIYLSREGGAWTLVDFGTGIDESELPAEVRAPLR